MFVFYTVVLCSEYVSFSNLIRGSVFSDYVVVCHDYSLLLTCITFIAHMWAYSYHCCTFSGPSVCQSVFQSYMSVYLSVCLSVTPMYHAEMAESIQMLFVKVK